ncbi:MAG: hypothetical protein R2698_12770 [Microthrixaceae bacterium]
MALPLYTSPDVPRRGRHTGSSGTGRRRHLHLVTGGSVPPTHQHRRPLLRVSSATTASRRSGVALVLAATWVVVMLVAAGPVGGDTGPAGRPVGRYADVPAAKAAVDATPPLPLGRPAPKAPRTESVGVGDTLWSIAARVARNSIDVASSRRSSRRTTGRPFVPVSAS